MAIRVVVGENTLLTLPLISSQHKNCYTVTMFNFLENPNHPSLGPHLKLLGFVGLLHPAHGKNVSFKRLLFYLTISFFISQYWKCLIKFNYDSLKLILQYIPFHLGIVKSCYFRKDHKLWDQLIDFISTQEQTQKSNIRLKSIREIIKKYIRENRRVTYFFWIFCFFCNFGIFMPHKNKDNSLNGTNVYMKMFDGYTPFPDYPPGYYASMMIQTLLGNVLSSYILSWDMMVVAMMIFFAGQMKIARVYCANIIDERNSAKSHKNITNFHRYYIDLIRHQKIFNSLISPVMFIYLLAVSLNLGICIIQLVKLSDLAALVSSVVFIAACLVQLLLFYWHSNEVTYESQQVSYGVFESSWPAADLKLKKKIFLLGFTTQKVLRFEAGPFHAMTLSTFIGILRTSYSFYALLNSTS